MFAQLKPCFHNENALIEVVMEVKVFLGRCHRRVARMHDYSVADMLQNRPGLVGPFFGIGLHATLTATIDGGWRIVVERRLDPAGGELVVQVQELLLTAPFAAEPVQKIALEADWTEKLVLLPACPETSSCKILWVENGKLLGKISLPLSKKKADKRNEEEEKE